MLTLASLARERGTSLTEMAGKMRPAISREHLSRLCNGRSQMTLSQACQIARLLGVEVNLIAAALPRRKEQGSGDE